MVFKSSARGAEESCQSRPVEQASRIAQVKAGTGYRPLPHRHTSVEILSQQCVAIMLSSFRVVNYQSRIPGQEFYTAVPSRALITSRSKNAANHLGWRHRIWTLQQEQRLREIAPFTEERLIFSCRDLRAQCGGSVAWGLEPAMPALISH